MIERVRADASVPSAVPDLPAQLGHLVTYWDSFDAAERGRVLETIFESLELDSRRNRRGDAEGKLGRLLRACVS